MNLQMELPLRWAQEAKAASWAPDLPGGQHSGVLCFSALVWKAPSCDFFCDFSLFAGGLFLIASIALVGHQGLFMFKLQQKILHE